MADINVDVNLPSAISVDITSPTQALATNISIPGPQGPAGIQGPSGIVNTGLFDLRYYSITNPSGFISGNLDLYATTINLASTGANLNTSINSLSGLFTGYTGSLDATYATDSQLNSTGNTLNIKIDNLSGYVNSQDTNISNNLSSTGSSLQTNINTLSSNLSLTGSNLENKITSLSGTLTGNYLTINSASSTYATINNLNSTGSTLNSSISSLSGTLTSNYATISNLNLTGSTLQSNINTITSNLITTGNTLQSNINTVSSNLISTGNALEGKISSLSGTLTSNYATITNLASTGSTLTSSINSLNSAFTGFTGNLDATYATDSQLSSTGITLINTINSLSGTLNSTGSTLIGSINSLSGTLTSTYATITNLASTGSTLTNNINLLSGWSASAANLASTGSTLNNNIFSLSGLFTGYTGNLDATFASDTQLANTGTTLVNTINSLSGTLTGNYLTANSASSTYATITNLASTGSNLNNKINSLSGTVTGNYVTKSNGQFTDRPTVNGTGVLLSGEAASLPTTILYTTGNQIKSGRLAIGDTIVDENYPYTLSLQSNSPSTWLEILNHSGSNKGVFFGIEGNDFEQYNWQGGDIKFFTSENASNGIERLRIKNDGKVGIGTIAPSEKLEVVGNLKVSNSGFFASGIKVGNNSIIITENRIDGGYAQSNGNLTDGLLGIQYSGYFDNDPEWFKTATIEPIINELTLAGASEGAIAGTYTRVGDYQNNQGTSYFQGPDGWMINYYNQYPTSESYWYLHPGDYNQYYTSNDLITWVTGLYGDVPPTATITQTQDFENSTNFSANRALSNGTSWEWVGYFIPQITETYNFYLYADEVAYFWLGEKALNGYTTGNADIVNNSNVQNLSLNSGQSYPVRLQWGHPSNPTNLGLSLGYQIPNLSFYSYDWSGVFFHGSAGKGFYIDAISGDAYFAGNIQSNTATFNNRPTVNGTGVVLSGEITPLPNTIVYTTGNQTISGVKSFAQDTIFGDSAQGDFLVISGNQFTVYGSGNFTSGLFVNGNAVLTGVNLSSYATVANLALTGSTLDNKINSLSGVAVLTYSNQTINGLKDFTTRPTVNTIPVLLSGEVNATISGVLYSAQINIKNDNGSTIYKGQPVYVSSAAGSNILVKLASNTGEQTSSKTLGLVYQTSLAQNAQGTIVTEGLLQGFNTNAGEEGDPIWLGPTGSLIFGLANKPYAPNHLVYLGVLTRKHANQGEIFVKIQNGFELQELHNVNIDHKNVLNDNDILRYNSASGLWFNETLNTGIFQTQINSLSGTLTGNYLTTSSASSTYATITNLGNTGSTLQTNINNLSNTYATITNLANTGSTLDTKINNLSGVSVLTFGNQTISGVKTFIGNHNISGNTTVSGFLNISGNYDIYSQIENSKKLAIAYAIAL